MKTIKMQKDLMERIDEIINALDTHKTLQQTHDVMNVITELRSTNIALQKMMEPTRSMTNLNLIPMDSSGTFFYFRCSNENDNVFTNVVCKNEEEHLRLTNAFKEVVWKDDYALPGYRLYCFE